MHSMTLIGIDSRKDLLAAAWVDDAGRLLEYRSVQNTDAGHAEMIAWSLRTGCSKVAIEGSDNYRRPVALALIDSGIDVVEVPPQMTAAARRRQRSNTKNDRVDAVLIGQITLPRR